jgi:DNA-directed RNA polymerase alpha subunit
MNDTNDFPTSMGNVAIRSLKENGINNLVEASTYTEKDLLSIHGVGPKAIRILKGMLLHMHLSLQQD